MSNIPTEILVRLRFTVSRLGIAVALGDALTFPAVRAFLCDRNINPVNFEKWIHSASVGSIYCVGNIYICRTVNAVDVPSMNENMRFALAVEGMNRMEGSLSLSDVLHSLREKNVNAYHINHFETWVKDNVGVWMFHLVSDDGVRMRVWKRPDLVVPDVGSHVHVEVANRVTLPAAVVNRRCPCCESLQISYNATADVWHCPNCSWSKRQLVEAPPGPKFSLGAWVVLQNHTMASQVVNVCWQTKQGWVYTLRNEFSEREGSGSFDPETYGHDEAFINTDATEELLRAALPSDPRPDPYHILPTPPQGKPSLDTVQSVASDAGADWRPHPEAPGYEWRPVTGQVRLIISDGRHTRNIYKPA